MQAQDDKDHRPALKKAADAARKSVQSQTQAAKPPSELRQTPSNRLWAALQKERDRLKSELERQDESAPERPTTGTHMADDALVVLGQTESYALKRHLKTMLDQVNLSLARIEKGTFGNCEQCGSPIHPERLQAIPYTTLCIDCAFRKSRSAAA